jgi:NtrC-family two-component system sensor histidine kinase KinB
MKLSIRTKFVVGMAFIFLIILVLFGFSAFYLNKLSNKTSAILKENYLSVVYARDMSEGLLAINQEVYNSFLTNTEPNKDLIRKELDAVDNSLLQEKNNITEPGEDKLVNSLEPSIREYRFSVIQLMGSPKNSASVQQLLKDFQSLHAQLATLSQINGKAIEVKSEDAKSSAKTALGQMSILGTLCFLIALSFIYSFSSYFNERFFQLYSGIKEIVVSNYNQRLYFEGVDEFYELSLLFNQMAEKLSENKSQEEKTVDFFENSLNDDSFNQMEELKSLLLRMKGIGVQADEIESKLAHKM